MSGDPRPNLLKLISLVHRKTQMYLNGRVEPLGLTSGQVPFLLIACETGGVPQNRFCALLDMDKSTVAKTLSRLEAQGYVRRRAVSGDGRAFDVLPTDRARDVYPFLQKIGDDWMDELASGLTDIERAIFSQMLLKVARNASRHFSEPGAPE